MMNEVHACALKLVDQLHGQIIGEPIKSRWEQSQGYLVLMPQPFGRCWLKVSATQVVGQRHRGYLDAASLPLNIHRPAWHASHTEPARSGYIVADLMEFVTAPTVSTNMALQNSHPILSDHWWHTLTESLKQLECVSTKRICTSKELIMRRVHEVFAVDLCEDRLEMQVIHGDMHWANLTQPECIILDWEQWGSGLRYQDVAMLYAMAATSPNVQSTIINLYPQLYSTYCGLASLLFIAAEVQFMNQRGGQYTGADHEIAHQAELWKSMLVALNQSS